GAETDNGVLFFDNGTLRVWNLDQKKEWRPPLGHTLPARPLTFLGEKGGHLGSSGDDRTPRVWDLANLADPATGWPREGRPTLSAPGAPHQAIVGASTSADGSAALTLVGTEAFVTVWRYEGGNWNPLSKLEWKDAPKGESLTAVSLSAD